MSRPFQTHINLNKLELQNAAIHNLAGAPANPVAGQVYFDTGTTRLYYCRVGGGSPVWIAADGSSVTYAASGTISTITPDAAAAAGSSTDVARGDHVHAIVAAAAGASAPGDVAAEGASSSFARADHTHGRESFAAPTIALGSAAAAGSAGTLIRSDATIAAFDTTAPSTQAIGDSAVVGTAAFAARRDHKHAMPGFGNVMSQLAFNQAATNGTASSVARSDHTHGTPAHSAAEHNFLRINDLQAAPNADYAFNNFTLTGLRDPTNPQDAATKAYVDAMAQGLDVKQSVRVATTANISATRSGNVLTASAVGVLTVDGVATVIGDRILVKDQTTAADNGIYIVTTAGTAGVAAVLARTSDADSSTEVTSGMFTFVEEGTANDNTGWILTTNNPITLNTTALVFAQFSGTGSITAGSGMTKTGSTLDVIAGATPSSTAGPGGGLKSNADDIVVDRTLVPFRFAQAFGDGTATTYVITHNLGTQDVQVTIYAASSPFAENMFDVEHTSVNTITIRSVNPVPTGGYRVVVMG